MRVFGSWVLTGRGSESTGSLVYRLANHHSYTDTDPQSWALSNFGFVGLTNTQFDDAGTKLGNLHWRQQWRDSTVVLLAGYQDIADFFDVYALADPFKHFQNVAFLTGAGTVSLPSSGALGVTFGGWINRNVYMQGGIADANADATEPDDGLETFFSDREFFTHFEVGLTSSVEKAYLDSIHLSVWHADEREKSGVNSAWGAAITASRWLEGGYLPFLKAGYSDDGSSLLQSSVSLGLGYQPNPIGSDSGNLLAVGLNWSQPNETIFGKGLDDQFAMEAMYRWQISRELAISGNLQYLKDPALNTSDSSTWVIGVRIRLAI